MAPSDPDPRQRVLVVDDEQEVIDMFQEYLAVDYDVTSALNSGRAIELFRASRPDLIFLDISMPGINGLDLLKAVKEIDRTIPVIMISASTDNALMAEAIRLGAFSFVPKPFDLRYLDHLVAAALSGRRR